MEGQAPPPDPGHGLRPRDVGSLRVSDADRHKVAEVLREAAGEGRLDLDELDERLEATYTAKTYADLVPITADLPAPGRRSPTPVAPGPAPDYPAATYSRSFSMMSECARRGVWEVSARHTAVTMMGSVVLDLREARFAAQETVIDAYAVMAGIDILVNAGTRVVVEGLGIMGDFSESRPKVPAQLTDQSPVVRVRGLALMGAVNVKRKEMPGTPRKFLGRF